MEDYALFNDIITRLQSTDNGVRSQAESAYEAIPAGTRLTVLLKVINDGSLPSESRYMSAILARRLLVSDYRSAFESLPLDTQVAIKQQLFYSLTHGGDNMMRKKVADLASELIRNQIDDDGNSSWPEFLPFLLECSNSSDPALRELACHIFAAVPNVFGNQQAANLIPIGQFLGQAISDQSSYDLRLAGVQALSSFIVRNATEESVLHALRELVPIALQAILAAVQTDSEDDSLLKALVEIADSAHKFLRPYLSSTLQLCYEILRMEELGESVRHVALEVMVTLAENAPASVRKCSPTVVKSLIGTLLKLMTDLEEEPEWDQADSEEELDDSTNAYTAELALDRLSCALGGQPVLGEIKQLVPEMLQSPDWRSRYAGLIAISVCGEGAGKQMEAMLGGVLQAVLGRLTDPHARVRYAACNCLGQMCTDFGPKIQRQHHASLLPALVHSLDDPVPRVQANAAAALVNFCDKVPQNILANYLESLVLKLKELLSKLVDGDRKLVLTQIVTTLASVADAAEKKFLPYYDLFMPTLKCIMEKAVHKELRLLRGRTIECISLIGYSVGREKFLQDAHPVMELLLAAQMQNDAETSENYDDPQVSYMISAWARMCKLLGPDFKAYLPKVMPQVLRSASIKPEVCILDNEEVDTVECDVDWEVVKLGEDQNYAIRTCGLEDKATACRMLVCYAREMKESFAPYCQQVFDIMIPLLDFYFNDEVRYSAAECLPHLFSIMQSTGTADLPAAWSLAHKSLLRAITNEPERDVVAEHLSSLAASLEAVGRQVVTWEQLAEIRVLLDHLFHEHFDKSDERLAKRQDEDYDEIEEERLMTEKDDDEFVLSKMCDVVHAVFVTFGEDAVPFFKQLMSFCVKLLEPSRPWSDLQWGICLWDDLIEFGGAHSWECHQLYLPAFLNALRHPQPEVRQAVFYGVGVAASNGPAEFASVLPQFVAPMIKAIDMPEARSEENNLSTENAISALTKLMKFRPDCIVPAFGNMDALITRWLSWLPIWEDDTETELVYNCLCDLLEANHPALLGPHNSNVPHIVRAIAQVMAKQGLSGPGADEEKQQQQQHLRAKPEAGDQQLNGAAAAGEKQPGAYARCVNVLRYVQSNPSLAEACLTQLNVEQVQAINAALMG